MGALCDSFAQGSTTFSYGGRTGLSHRVRPMPGQAVSQKLKALRERTGLSVRAVAERLGVPASTYASKENKFKKRYLPVEFVESLIPVFTPLGVTEDELRSLAGHVPEGSTVAQRMLAALNRLPPAEREMQLRMLELRADELERIAQQQPQTAEPTAPLRRAKGA